MRQNFLRDIARKIKAMKVSSLVVRSDVTSANSVNKMIQTTLNNFGRIDILVNCAGVSTMANVIDLKEKEWDHVMNVNAKGVFLCSKYAARQMLMENLALVFWLIIALRNLQ